MFTFIIKNVVKSYASDLTLIAATQIALFKKIIVYMEEKYLVCYPVYKSRLTSGQAHDVSFEKHQSQCTLQSECSLANWVIVSTPPPEVCTKRPQMVFSTKAREIQVWKRYEELLEQPKPIRRSTWFGAIHIKPFFKKISLKIPWQARPRSQSRFLEVARRTSGPPAGPEAGWLEGAVAREEATRCGLHGPFPGSSPSSLWPFRDRGRVVRQSRPLGKYISFKIKARKSRIRGMFCQHPRPGVDGLTKPQQAVRPRSPQRAQARARAHQESCLTEDVTSAGEARLTPMYNPSWPEYLSSLFSALALSPAPDITEAPAWRKRGMEREERRGETVIDRSVRRHSPARSTPGDKGDGQRRWPHPGSVNS